MRARCCCLCVVFEWTSSLYLGEPPPWSLGDSPVSLWPSGLVWSGSGDVETLILHGEDVYCNAGLRWPGNLAWTLVAEPLLQVKMFWKRLGCWKAILLIECLLSISILSLTCGFVFRSDLLRTWLLVWLDRVLFPLVGRWNGILLVVFFLEVACSFLCFLLGQAFMPCNL